MSEVITMTPPMVGDRPKWLNLGWTEAMTEMVYQARRDAFKPTHWEVDANQLDHPKRFLGLPVNRKDGPTIRLVCRGRTYVMDWRENPA